MTVEFRLPDLGENVEKGEVVRMLVSEGDTVARDQVVMELETDKALLEVPSPAAGRVAKVHCGEGAVLRINDMILTIEESAEAAADGPAKTKKADAGSALPKASPAMSEPKSEDGADRKAGADGTKAEEPKDPAGASAARQEARVVEVPKPPKGKAAPAAPSTRTLARELGVDLSDVKGSGSGGRISEEDVLAYVRSRTKGGGGTAASPSGAGGAPTELPDVKLPDFTQWGDVERQKMSGVRRKTLEHLTLSWRTIPHVTQIDEADVTELEALRKRHAQKAAAKGGKLTATVFVMKAVVAALKQYPQFNASVDAASEELILKRYYNLGIAVDTEHGLIVPVIKDADRKHLLDISAEVLSLSERTRARKIKPDELQGGTFTISNLGGIGGSAFTPIINHPEVAILGLATYQKRLMLSGDRMETRMFLPLCLSYDHRVIDGADAIRFTRKIAEMLEDPAMLLLEG